MENLLNKLTEGKTILINNIEYKVKTKTWYSIEEDNEVKYVKCELSNNKALVIIPDDNLIYIGQVIEKMNYKRISKNEIQYNDIIFSKTGDGHQYILNVEFGNEKIVEGKCIFEDYESNNNIISLGFLTDKKERADVYADILNKEDIKIL